MIYSICCIASLIILIQIIYTNINSNNIYCRFLNTSTICKYWLLNCFRGIYIVLSNTLVIHDKYAQYISLTDKWMPTHGGHTLLGFVSLESISAQPTLVNYCITIKGPMTCMYSRVYNYMWLIMGPVSLKAPISPKCSYLSTFPLGKIYSCPKRFQWNRPCKVTMPYMDPTQQINEWSSTHKIYNDKYIWPIPNII